MVIIFGTLHLLRRNRLEERDWCEHCRKRFRLQSYTAWECAHVYWIPILPYGRIRAIRRCPRCNRLAKMGLGKARQQVQASHARAREAIARGEVDRALEEVFQCAYFGGFQEAEELLSSLNATDARVLRAQGRFSQMRRLFPQAEDLLRQATSRQPNDPQGWYFLGESLVEAGKVEPGLEALSRAAELAPQAVDVRLTLTDELQKRKRWDELLPVLEQLAAIQPAMTEDRSFRKLLETARKKAGPGAGRGRREEANPYAMR